jgi:hypothetical protein
MEMQPDAAGSIFSRAFQTRTGRSLVDRLNRLQSALDRQLDKIGPAPTAQANIDFQRSKLAAIETVDARVLQAVKESFVSGYRKILSVQSGCRLRVRCARPH